MSISDKPLVSFVLLAYNQEKYIHEAVEGAFAQTYSPLEIILSDDCSHDQTFEIMQKMEAEYRGPHKIVLNKNPKNLGIGGHVNRCMELANGEWTVVAAGDDISRENRTQVLVSIWQQAPYEVKMVYSNYTTIGDNASDSKFTQVGHPPENLDSVYLSKNQFFGVTGASTSWHKDLFDYFGKMDEGITFEDKVLAFRAALLGTIRHTEQSLVVYRKHNANTINLFTEVNFSATRRLLECHIAVHKNNKRDLKHFATRNPGKKAITNLCKKHLARELLKLESHHKISKGGFSHILIGMFGLIYSRGNPLAGIRMAWKAIRFPSH